MEVYSPCDKSSRQDITRNSGSSIDPRNITRCSGRDLMISDLKTCLAEILSIEDVGLSSRDFDLSLDKNEMGNLVRQDERKDSGECEMEEEMFDEKQKQVADLTAEISEGNISVNESSSMFLSPSPTPLKLVSAMKGSREKQGIIPPKKLSVTWDPDVYDPIPTSVSHVPKNYQRYHSDGKRHGKNKHKGGGKSSRGGNSSKDKKQARKNANKLKL